jgi:hypothetical protein
MAKAVFDNLGSTSPASPFVVSAEVYLPIPNNHMLARPNKGE